MKTPALHGVLVVDKPIGPTSHDVVARVRRALHERRVGHAGTLDPMASGVLVVLVGEATKLAPFLTGHDKVYRTRVALGAATDTLDAEGEVVARAPPSPALLAELASVAAGTGPGPLLEAALAGERARREQVPPAFSAVKVDGVRSYARARAGAEVELAPRPVEVRRLELLAAGAGDAPFVEVELEVTKGYYVRSFGLDLGERLGVPAHLSALRRTSSGPFAVAAAAPLDAIEPGRVDPLAAAAARALGAATLNEAGTLRVRQGRAVDATSFAAPPPDAPTAWLDPAGALVAIGARQGELWSVLRGFAGAN